MPATTNPLDLSVRMGVGATDDDSKRNVMLERHLGRPMVEGVRIGNGPSDEMGLVTIGYDYDGVCKGGLWAGNSVAWNNNLPFGCSDE